MRKKTIPRWRFFTPPGPRDPIGSILAEGANIVVGHGLKRLSREAAKLLGVSGNSLQEEIALNRSRTLLS